MGFKTKDPQPLFAVMADGSSPGRIRDATSALVRDTQSAILSLWNLGPLEAGACSCPTSSLVSVMRCNHSMDKSKTIAPNCNPGIALIELNVTVRYVPSHSVRYIWRL